MQFNVSQLLKEPIGAVRTYELVENIDQIDPELTVLGPLVGRLKLIRIHSGILARAELSSAAEVTCNRCLSPIASPIRCSIEEMFHPLTDVGTGRYIHPSEFEGASQELEDPALIIDEQHILDISEVVRQALWLSLPMYPGCNWEGSGECPNMTAYLQEVREMETYTFGEELPEPEPDEVDPRWAALLALRGEVDEET